MSRDYFTLKLEPQECIDIIRQQLTGPNREELAVAIIALLEDRWRINKLIKICNGIRIHPELIIGQQYMWNCRWMPTFNCNEDKMKMAGIIVDGRMKVKVIGYNPYAESEYTIKYKNENGKVITSSVKPDTLSEIEEWF